MRRVLLFLLVLLSACEPQSTATPAPTDPADETATRTVPGDTWLETGDLDAIAHRGVLRILIHLDERAHLPRKDHPRGIGRHWLRRFGRQQGLETRVVAVEKFADLIPALLEGRGDVIASNLTALPERTKQVRFTRPLDNTREWLVARSADALPEQPDLSGKTLAVQAGTSFALSAEALLAQHPGLQLKAIDGRLSNDAIFDQLVEGEFDLTIADGNFLDTVHHYRKDIGRVFPVSVSRDIGWAVRPGAARLLGELNRFISQEKIASPTEFQSLADLDDILDRKMLRVVSYNTMASYFLWRGELYGFEYELARRFAEHYGLHLQMLVAENYPAMLDLLRNGKADIAAAFITPTPWRESINIAFSRPYHYASEVLVSRPDQPAQTLEQLGNRAIVVRKSSSYWQTLQDLVSRGHILKLRAADEALDTEHLIDEVGRGDIDLTAADSHILALELTWRDDVTGTLSLSDPRPQSWAVRESNPQLLQAINQFFTREYNSDFYNTTYHRYFKAPRISARWQQTLPESGAISAYDELIRRYAGQYGFDWLLLAAQIYQESRFDAAASAWSGARGLMQVLPQTARTLGFTEIQDPETGLHAGVKYLAWLYGQFEDSLAPDERMWFSLAAYNAGIGHLRDARVLARRLGKDPDRWFEHVEEAMILLSRKKYASKARHGYVRGMEPVQYVRNIRQHYRTFSEATRTPVAAAPD